MSDFAEATLHQAFEGINVNQEAPQYVNPEGGTAEITWIDVTEYDQCHRMCMRQLSSKALKNFKAEVEASFHLSLLNLKIKTIRVTIDSADVSAGTSMSWADLQQLALRQSMPLQMVFETKNVLDPDIAQMNADLRVMEINDDLA